jgi:hypothetical protein
MIDLHSHLPHKKQLSDYFVGFDFPDIFKNFELSYHLLICRCLVWDKITMLWIHWAIVEECWVNSIWDYSFCILWIFFSSCTLKIILIGQIKLNDRFAFPPATQKAALWLFCRIWFSCIFDYSFCILWIFFSCKFIPHLSIPPSTLNIIDLKVEKCRKIKSYKIIRELLFVWQVGMQIYFYYLQWKCYWGNL